MQSIIVYRSPAEAHFWESGMAFPLMVSMVASLITTILVLKINSVLQRKKSYFDRHRNDDTLAIIAAVASFFITMWIMI